MADAVDYAVPEVNNLFCDDVRHHCGGSDVGRWGWVRC